MADVQFEEEQQYRQGYQAEHKPLLIRLVLATGIVSTDKQAEYVLLGVAAALLLIAIFVAFSGGQSTPSENPYVEGQNVLLSPGAPRPSI